MVCRVARKNCLVIFTQRHQLGYIMWKNRMAFIGGMEIVPQIVTTSDIMND